jgi:hypothetical protein
MSFIQSASNSNASGASSIAAGPITVNANDCLIVIVLNLQEHRSNATVSDGVNTYVYAGTAYQNSTVFASAPGPGATSATLNTTFPGTSGTYTLGFSDGEQRQATFTNGSAAVSWTGGLTPPAGATLTTQLGNWNSGFTQQAPRCLDCYVASNIVGGSTTVTATLGGGLSGIYVAEYSNIVQSNPLQGFVWQPGAGGGGNNAISSGSTGLTETGPVFLYGFCINTTADSSGLTAGTSPIVYTGRAVGSGWTANGPVALAEDATQNSSGAYAATFTGNGSGMLTAMIALSVGSIQGSVGVRRRRYVYHKSYYPK